MKTIFFIAVLVAAASSVTDVVLFAIGLRGRELSTHSRRQRILLGIGVFVISLVLGVAAYKTQFPTEVPETAAAPSTGIPIERPKSSSKSSQEVRSSPVTFQELMSYIYEEIHTDIQQDDFLKRHLGRRVTWDGWLGGVSDEREEGVSVLLTDEEGSTSHVAFLSFPQEDRVELASLSFGQRLRATCTFANFDARAHLDDCELVKVWPAGEEGLDDSQEKPSPQGDSAEGQGRR